MKKLLIIGQVWPESKSSAAGWRMIQLIDKFKESGFKVHFASGAAKSEFSDDLKALNVAEHSILLNSSSFDAFIRGINPEVVVFDRFVMEEQYGWRVAEQCPNAVKILDTEDLHFLRKTREKAFKAGENWNDVALQNEAAIREVASIYRCDLTLIISDYELNLLKGVFNIPEHLLVYLPFESKKIDESKLLAEVSFKNKEHFMFIGNLIHAPNYDAVLHLKNNIWKSIRKELPKAELHIYGAYESQKVSQLNNEKEGFLIKGRASSSEDVIRKARVMLAPLRFGAGIKGKLLESMQFGTPSVTSSIGAEGMNGDLDWNGFVTDDDTDFVAHSIELYQNEEVWQESLNNGVEINNQRFANSQNTELFIERLGVCLKDINEFRQQNFVGKMLLHHSMQSGKYFSKWIEEKNK